MSTPVDTHPLVDQLRSAMERKHLTQVELARKLGVSERTVSYWMTTDTTPQKRYRRRIIEWLEAA